MNVHSSVNIFFIVIKLHSTPSGLEKGNGISCPGMLPGVIDIEPFQGSKNIKICCKYLR